MLPVLPLRPLYIFKAWCFGMGTKFIVFTMAQQPLVGQSPRYRGFTITLRHTTLGRTPLDE